MAYDPKVRHHWQMMPIVRTMQADDGRVVAVCELCGTVRTYEIASKTDQMILGGACPGTSPEPK